MLFSCSDGLRSNTARLTQSIAYQNHHDHHRYHLSHVGYLITLHLLQ
jgi:hypothetical protein